MTDDVRNRTPLVTMAGALAAVDTAVAALERAHRSVFHALPAGHDLLVAFERTLPAVRVLQRRTEQTLAQVPAGR